MLTRRKLLFATAPAALALAGCGTLDPSSISTSVVDFIQQAVKTVAQYIPTAESIATLAASLFGPAWASVVQFGSNALNTIIAALTSLVTQAPPPAKARLMARLRAVPYGAAITIGVVNGVAIHGYR